MDTSNTLDLSITLTEAELQHLWASVPPDRQECEELVRISLRPELDSDYTGPVELNDLRLAVSPWLWSRAELASSPRTQSLNQALAEVRARNPDMELDTMPEVVQWLIKKLKGTPDDWTLSPDHPSFWDDCEIFQLMRDSENGTFVPIDMEFSAVWFYTEPEGASSSRIVVAQTSFDTGENSKRGPIGIYACPLLIAENTTNPLDWLFSSGRLVLTGPGIGEHANLVPGSMDAADDDYEDGQEMRRGVDPVFADAKSGLPANGQAPTWISEPLHYKAGRLYLTSTSEQTLTLELFLPPGRMAN